MYPYQCVAQHQDAKPHIEAQILRAEGQKKDETQDPSVKPSTMAAFQVVHV